MPCRILNVSEGGAKLRPVWKGWVPNAFELRDVFTGVHRAVWTVWNGLSGIGVRFHERRWDEPRESGFARRRRQGSLDARQ